MIIFSIIQMDKRSLQHQKINQHECLTFDQINKLRAMLHKIQTVALHLVVRNLKCLSRVSES